MKLNELVGCKYNGKEIGEIRMNGIVIYPRESTYSLTDIVLHWSTSENYFLANGSNSCYITATYRKFINNVEVEKTENVTVTPLVNDTTHFYIENNVIHARNRGTNANNTVSGDEITAQIYRITYQSAVADHSLTITQEANTFSITPHYSYSDTLKSLSASAYMSSSAPCPASGEVNIVLTATGTRTISVYYTYSNYKSGASSWDSAVTTSTLTLQPTDFTYGFESESEDAGYFVDGNTRVVRFYSEGTTIYESGRTMSVKATSQYSGTEVLYLTLYQQANTYADAFDRYTDQTCTRITIYNYSGSGTSVARSRGDRASVGYDAYQIIHYTRTYTSGLSEDVNGGRATWIPTFVTTGDGLSYDATSGEVVWAKNPKENKTSNRTGTLKATYNGVQKGSAVSTSQAKVVWSFSIYAYTNSQTNTVPAKGGSIGLFAIGYTEYDNGDDRTSQNITGWSCTGTGTERATWSYANGLAKCATLGTYPTSGNNKGVFTVSWESQSSSIEVFQSKNTQTLKSKEYYFVFGNTAYSPGISHEVDSSAQSIALSCYYVKNYTYTSEAEDSDTLNGAIKSVTGDWLSFSGGTLTVNANSSFDSRSSTITGTFENPTDTKTITLAQEGRIRIDYGVGWEYANMWQSGGHKNFAFAITYNSNLTGKKITVSAMKRNGNVLTTVATHVVNSLPVSRYECTSFGANESSQSGDEYFLTFSYDGQSFSTGTLTNAYYLDNARVLYSAGSTIYASGSNYAYVVADLMQGGRKISSDETCTVTNTLTGFSVSGSKITASDRGTTTGVAKSASITGIKFVDASYGTLTLSVSLSVTQEANAVTSTAHNYTYGIVGLSTSYPSASPCPSAGGSSAITYTQCKQYDTPTYTYTSGHSATGSATTKDITPTFSSNASYATISGANVVIAKNGNDGRARNFRVTAMYGTVIIGYVVVYQTNTKVSSYELIVSSSASTVAASGGSVTLSATARTNYDNGNHEDSAISTGWTCTNTGSVKSGIWSIVNGNRAAATSLGSNETSSVNIGTFSLTWNGVTKTVSVAQSANTRVYSYTYALQVDGTEYASGSTIDISYSARSMTIYGLRKSKYYLVAAPSTLYTGATNTQPITSTSLDSGFTWSAPTLSVTANTSTTATRSATLVYAPSDGNRYTVSVVQAKKSLTNLYLVMRASDTRTLYISSSSTSLSRVSATNNVSVSFTLVTDDYERYSGTADFVKNQSQKTVTYDSPVLGVPSYGTNVAITGNAPTGYQFVSAIYII